MAASIEDRVDNLEKEVVVSKIITAINLVPTRDEAILIVDDAISQGDIDRGLRPNFIALIDSRFAPTPTISRSTTTTTPTAPTPTPTRTATPRNVMQKSWSVAQTAVTVTAETAKSRLLPVKGASIAWYAGGVAAGGAIMALSRAIPFGSMFARTFIGLAAGQGIAFVLDRKWGGDSKKVITQTLKETNLSKKDQKRLESEIYQEVLTYHKQLKANKEPFSNTGFHQRLSSKIDSLPVNDSIKQQTADQLLAVENNYGRNRFRAQNVANGMRMGATVVAVTTLAAGYFGADLIPPFDHSPAAPYEHALYIGPDPIYSQIPEVGPHLSSAHGLGEAKMMGVMGLNADSSADHGIFNSYKAANFDLVNEKAAAYADHVRLANLDTGWVKGDLVDHFKPINLPGGNYANQHIFTDLPRLK